VAGHEPYRAMALDGARRWPIALKKKSSLRGGV
jgi:hypothetical protein